jgi:hypothetical protein
MKTREEVQAKLDDLRVRQGVLKADWIISGHSTEGQLQDDFIRVTGVIETLEWILGQDPEDMVFNLMESEIEQ